jgi:hypothetical protein
MQMLTKHFRLELFDDSVAISRYNLLSLQDLTLETTKICLISRNVKCVIFFFFFFKCVILTKKKTIGKYVIKSS